MAQNGVNTENIGNHVTLAKEFVVNGGNGTGIQAFGALAQQLSGTGSVADRLNSLDSRAFTDAVIHNNVAAGLAATGIGGEFKVKTDNPSLVAYYVYQNVAGSGVLISAVPAGTALGTKQSIGSATIAAAALTDIGALDASAIRLTGTAAVASLGNAEPGTRKVLYCDEKLTFVHGATLIMAAGANFTAVAGSSLEFQAGGTAEATVWRQIAPTTMLPSDFARPDIAIAEVDSNGKTINLITTDGKHVHEHKKGTIKTDELEQADRLKEAPTTSETQRVDFPVIVTDSVNRRLWGVDQQGRFFGPSSSPLASEKFSQRHSAPDFAVSYQVRRRTVTVSTAETYEKEVGGGFPADAVAGKFERLPDLMAEGFSLANPLAETLEFRRALADVDGSNYRGGWDPSGGAVPVPGDSYRPKVGWWWQVTTTAGNFSEGDRVVMIGAIASSTGFAVAPQGFVLPDGQFTQDTPNGILFRVVPSGTGRFYRGEWDPASAAYPAPANLAAGNVYIVSAAGSYDGVDYAYGDHLVRTAGAWTKEAQEPITEVVAGATVSFDCPSGSLRDWEVRKKTNSAPVAYFDLRCDRRELVTARVHDVGGNKHIWLHFQDGSVDKLAEANLGNSYAPTFDGSILVFKSDRTGAEATYQMAIDRIPGKFGRARRVYPARSNFVVTAGDSYGDRWGFPFLYQIAHDDSINGRAFDRRGVTLDGGSLDEHYIASIVTALGEGATGVDYLSGIVCYILDWNNGREDERAAIMRALAAVRGRTPRFLVAGNTAGRDIRWNGATMQVYSSFVGNAQKIEDEARLEEMMGGEFFEGGNYANMRKWTISSRNPRFNASEWDPVLQMSVGDVAATYGFWSLWTLVDIGAENYPAMRANINEANFQGYIDDQAEIVSSTDWHYYVGTGVGDATEGTTYYKLGGSTYSIGAGDGVHLPAATATYGYTAAQMTVTGPDSDTSNMMNLMAYDVVTELSARGWLD